MDFSERIQTIIKVNNLSTSSFAEKIGVQRSGVSHILNGRNKPSMDFLEKVLEQFPRVDPGWLLTGKSPGAPPKENAEADREEIREPLEETASSKEKRVVRIVMFYDDHTFDTYQPGK